MRIFKSRKDANMIEYNIFYMHLLVILCIRAAREDADNDTDEKAPSANSMWVARRDANMYTCPPT
jgi:hypothetical protein